MLQIAICEDREAEGEYLYGIIKTCLTDAGKEANIIRFQSGFDLLHHTANIGHFHIIFINASLSGLNGIETIKSCANMIRAGLLFICQTRKDLRSVPIRSEHFIIC